MFKLQPCKETAVFDVIIIIIIIIIDINLHTQVAQEQVPTYTNTQGV
jgi:hypothetical protein